MCRAFLPNNTSRRQATLLRISFRWLTDFFRKTERALWNFVTYTLLQWCDDAQGAANMEVHVVTTVDLMPGLILETTMRRRLMAIVFGVALLAPQYAFTWNGRGHMMVAALAYQKLNQATKDRVDALLLLNPDRDNWLDLIPAGTSAPKRKMMIFTIAATWADRIKSDPDYHTDGTHNGNRPPNDPSAGQNIGYDDLARHKYWHFVDLPFSDDNTTLPSVPTPNAGTQIAKFRAVLNSVSNDPNVEKLKSFDLSWLLHLVGDLHQPLHATTRVSAHRSGRG
jgi:S1/P1 Nuclease